MHTKSILFVASLFGTAIAGGATGCSSSSSGSPAATDDASMTDDSGGGSSGGDAEAGVAITCMDSTSCTGGQVCCVALSGTTPSVACAAAPCAPLAIIGVSVQLCSKDSECPSGQVCGKTGNTLVDGIISMMGGKACGAGEGGTTSDGGSSSGGTTDGGSSSGSSTEGGTDSGSSSGGEGGTDAPAE